MADGLLNKASIILTPTGYKAGTLYNVAPVVEPYEDFDFARASVASRVNSSGLVEMVGRTLGSELVQNGDFSELGNNVLSSTWSTGSGWSVITDGVSCDGSVSGGNVVNNVELTDYNGKQFLLTYTLSNVTDSSTLRYKFGGGSLVVINGTEGTHSVYITNDATVDNFQFVSSTGWAGDVTNISLKQVDPNDYWTLGTGWSIGDGKATSDGSQTANSLLYQSGILSIGTTFKAQLTLSNYQSGTLRFVLGGGGSEISCSSNGTFTFYGNKGADNNLYLSANSTFEGSIDNVSVKEIIDTNNIPRINYDSNGDNGHILLEPTSTNLLPYSEDFSEWTAGGNTIIYPNYTAPDGTNSAYKVSGSSGALTYAASATSTQTRTIWAKTVSGTGQAHLCSYFDNTNNLKTITNEWQRFEVNGTTTTTGVTTFYAIDFRGSTDLTEIILWGAQLEELSYATSYIPTLTGSQEVRATETATGAGSADLINSTEGVLYAEIAMLSEDDKASNNQLFISDGTANQRIGIFIESAGDVRAQIKDSGETPGSRNLTALDQSESGVDTAAFNKIAILYKSGQNKLFVNGSRITDTNFDSMVFNFSSLDNLEFGSGANSNYFRGKCKSLAVFNEALTDDELTQLTT